MNFKSILIRILLLQIFIYAQNPVPPSSGDGTVGNPYQIATLDNLYWIANDAANWDEHYVQISDIDASPTAEWFSDGSGGFYGWVPIGTEAVTFTGSYNGQNFDITGIYLNRTSIDYTGLFGYLGGDSVFLKNIDLISVNMNGGVNYSGGLAGCYWYDGTVLSPTIESCSVSGTVSGGWGVGGLIGTIYEKMNISKCTSSVTINCPDAKSVGCLIGYNYIGTVSECSSSGNVSGNDFTGGLIGYNETGSVSDCYSSGIISGKNCVGGLIGYHENALISDCYSTADVSTETGYYIGGLVGYSYAWDYPVINCYATGAVSGYSSVGGLVGENRGPINYCYSTGSTSAIGYYVGGLAGNNVDTIRDSYSTSPTTGYSSVGGLAGVNWYSTSTIANCYSTGSVSGTTNTGGLLGFNMDEGIISDSFWDIETSGQDTSAGGTGKTTFDMKSESTYTDAGWDFLENWYIYKVIRSYPHLMWETMAIEPSYFPNNLSTSYSSNSLQITWDPPPEPYLFRVYSSTDPYADFPSASWILVADGITERTWTDTNATGTKKFYIVVAVN